MADKYQVCWTNLVCIGTNQWLKGFNIEQKLSLLKFGVDLFPFSFVMSMNFEKYCNFFPLLSPCLIETVVYVASLATYVTLIFILSGFKGCINDCGRLWVVQPWIRLHVTCVTFCSCDVINQPWYLHVLVTFVFFRYFQ